MPSGNSTNMTSTLYTFIVRAPLLGTAFLGVVIWLKYVLVKSSLEARMATVERVSQEKWDQIYRMEITNVIERNSFTGAILILWFVYLVWRWIRAFRKLQHP